MSDGENCEVTRVRELAELMAEFDLSEISFREGDNSLRLRRGGQVQTVAAAAPIAPAASAPAQAAAPAAGADDSEDNENIVVISSPMVGTFYSRANPKAAPYVKVGDNIEPETTVCIVEAMKVFNEIPAETRGQIVAVLVDDEEPVEFGKPLFKVDTSK